MMKFKAAGKLAAFSFVLLTLSGCMTSQREAFLSRLDTGEWSYDTRLSGDFYLFRVLSKNRSSDTLNVVIEGDGRAWLTRFKPSKDPTPVSPMGFWIARKLQGLTAYLARPCQYVKENEKLNCAPVMWTSARFAKEVVRSTITAIDQIKRDTSATKIRLFGYSGGGALAAVIAGRRSDVIELVTIAAPLDIDAWSRYHDMSRLKYSVNPINEIDSWGMVRQRHYAGGKDKVVPYDLYKKSLKTIATKANVRLHIMKNYTHTCCWQEFDFNSKN